MSAARWTAALRLARRDATRNKGRSALIVALIGVPIMLLGVADIGYHTYQLSPRERITRQIGAADAGLEWSASREVQQGPSAWLGSVAIGTTTARVPSTAAVAALLPAGSRLIEQRVGERDLVFRTAAGLDQSPLIGLDYHDPIAAGLVTQRSGSAPRNRHEVAVTTALAAATGLRVGDVIRTQGPSRAFTVVGTVTDTSDQRDRALYSVPAAVSLASATSAGVSLSSAPGQPGLTWLAHTPRPVTWHTVERGNRAGLLVLSRSVYLHPNAAALAADAHLSGAGGASGQTPLVAVLALIGGMALLEVVLLAGPAFAVGAKRRRRDLALVAASGGSARDVRRVVLAGGVVLGVSAGVAGVVAAIGVARLGLPFLRPHVARLPGTFDIHPVDLLVLAGVAVLAAIMASVAPARAAGRTDVVAALSGRPAPATIRLRVPVLAAVLAGAGVLVALAGATAGGNTAALAILGGTALVEMAIIVSTPTLLVLAARGGRRLPLTARMALRDAGRNRSAATPAVAAVMASVVGATAILIGITSYVGQQRREYTPSLPELTAAVLGVPGSAGAHRMADALRSTLPTSSVAVLDRPDVVCHRSHGACRITGLALPGDPGSFGSIPSLLVDDGSLALALFGSRAPQARAALASGKAVVAERSALRDGRVRLVTTRAMVRTGQYLGNGRDTRHEVPAVHVASGRAGPLVVVPSSVASDLGVRTEPYMVLARLRHAPDDMQQQAALARLRCVVPDPGLTVETGYHDSYAALELALVLAAVAVAVLAAVIATGLANVDARRDLTTLAAVGASPRIRRALATSRAAVIAGLGSAVGVAAGFLAPAAWVYGDREQLGTLHLSVPWTSVLTMAVAVPLLASLIAAATTRAGLPVE